MTENFSSGYAGQRDCPECNGKQTVEVSGGSSANYSWDTEKCTDCGYRKSEKFHLSTSGQRII